MTKQENKNRYSGKDEAGWVVRDVTGHPVKDLKPFDSYSAAQTAAVQYNQRTGLPAFPARA